MTVSEITYNPKIIFVIKTKNYFSLQPIILASTIAEKSQ